MKKKYEAIDGLRALSCIGIVMMHVQANANFDIHGFVFDSIIPSFTQLVFLFMVISGFGMCCGYYEKLISGKIDIVSFYKKRYMKILPFFALLCILDFIISPSLEALREVFLNLTLCFGLIPNVEISVIGVAWFLGVVFAFYLLFPFYCFLISNKYKACFSFFVSLLMNFIVDRYYNCNRKSIVFCFVFFLAGGLVYLYRDKLSNKMFRNLSLAVLLISCIILFWFTENVIVILLIVTALLVIALSVEGKGILINRFTKFIGGLSFEIYLCHMLVFRVLEKVHLLKLTGNDYLNYLITILIVFAGATVFAYLGKMFIDKGIRIIEKFKISSE